MSKFEFHFFTSFWNYFNKNWIEKCTNKPTLWTLKTMLETRLEKINEKLEELED